MQRVSRWPSFLGSICWHSPRFLLGHQWLRQLRHQSTHPAGNTQVKSSPNLDDTHLIDPSSLRNTLQAVREANRATLIKKVDEDGNFSSIQVSNGSDPPGVSRPLSLSDRNDEKGPHAKLRKVQRKSLFSPGRKLLRNGPITRSRKGDYAGQEYGVQAEWQTSSRIGRWRRPWIAWMDTSDVNTTMDAKRRLGAEIHAFSEYFTPKPSENYAVQAILRDIRAALISSGIPHNLELMGSRATGLASPLSDLDLNFTPDTGSRLDEVEDKAQIHTILKKVYRHLAKSRKTIRINEFVSWARVPIISGVHKSTTLEFQIQCTNSIYNSAEYAKTFLREYPTLRSLFLVLKQTLNMRGLCQGHLGGLTSYPLLNMIVACLKLKCSHLDTRDVAGHLLAFFDMYSEIDFYKTGISISPPAFISLLPEEVKFPPETADEADAESVQEFSEVLKRHSRESASYRMCLIDPADPSNDLGSGTHMIKHVQATIIPRREVLRSKMQTWELTPESERPISILGCLLEGDYKTYELDRASLKRGLQSGGSSHKDEFMRSMSDWNI